jgi:alcohol dehydrogenase (cytochrome c)
VHTVRSHRHPKAIDDHRVVGCHFYALDTATGPRLWGKDLGGAIGGGVITYSAGGAQKVAVAVGFTNILWPTKVATGKIVILGLLRA